MKLQVVNPNPNKLPNLRSKLVSIATGVLIFVFTGILYNTHKSGSIMESGSPPSPEVTQQESVNIAAIYSGTISRNSSLYSELLNRPIPKSLISTLTSHFSRLFDLRGSKPGDTFKLFMGPGNTIVAFEYLTNDWKRYRLDKEGNEFVATINEIGLEKKVTRVEGIIQSSLWDALLPILPDMEIFGELTDIFGWEIDFLTDPRIGDTFRFIFESFEKDGKYVKPGKILAAEYTLAGMPHRAFLFVDSTGRKDYYDENGYSLRKSLLKSPLNYRRISSTFSFRRLHPIYKYYRPHLGVDYSAAAGTPVVAAGDGQVTYRGWKSGFGNYIEVKHANSMTTCYGHLSGFAKGLSSGGRVNQGQVIGYVGSTGESTGPHLDYRVMKNGRFVDPLKMVVPASLPVEAKYKAEFQALVADYMPKLENKPAQPVLAQGN